MPYLGNNPTANFATVTKDTFSGNGSTTAFTLSKTATTNGVAVYVENVRQIPTTAYAISGTTLTFTAAPVSGTNNIYVMHHNTPVSTATHPSAQALTATSGTFSSTLGVTDDLLLLSDSAAIKFGADSEITLTHSADDGLILKHVGTGDGKEPSLTFQAGDNDIAVDDILGQIQFQAPDEGAGTDAQLVAAAITAVSEGDFSASNNATGLRFATGASETATTKMILNSAGDLALQADGGSIKFGANSEIVLSHSHNEGLKLLTTAATGSLLTLGTTSTSVSDEAFIGGIDFASGSSPTVQARVHGKQEGTAEVGGHLSFETRASGGSLSERLKIDSIGRILATTTGARSIIGRGAYTGITVDNGSTTSVAGNNGVLFNMVMVSTGGGFGAVYSMAYNSAVNLINGTGNFSASSGTSSSTNVYKSSGSHAVTLQNNTGSAVTYYILCIVSYD
jgi:hypothetical protein